MHLTLKQWIKCQCIHKQAKVSIHWRCSRKRRDSGDATATEKQTIQWKMLFVFTLASESRFNFTSDQVKCWLVYINTRSGEWSRVRDTRVNTKWLTHLHWQSHSRSVVVMSRADSATLLPLQLLLQLQETRRESRDTQAPSPSLLSHRQENWYPEASLCLLQVIYSFTPRTNSNSALCVSLFPSLLLITVICWITHNFYECLLRVYARYTTSGNVTGWQSRKNDSSRREKKSKRTEHSLLSSLLPASPGLILCGWEENTFNCLYLPLSRWMCHAIYFEPLTLKSCLQTSRNNNLKEEERENII